MPIPIPREHFAVPLREKRKAGPNDVGALVQLGYAMPNGYTGPVEWVDGDYDERTGQVLNVRPATSLDIEGAAPLHGPDRDVGSLRRLLGGGLLVGIAIMRHDGMAPHCLPVTILSKPNARVRSFRCQRSRMISV